MRKILSKVFFTVLAVHVIGVGMTAYAGIPVLTVTGFTANGVPMAGSLEAGYLLETDSNPNTIYEIKFAEGSHVNKSVGDYYYTLYLNTALSVDNNTLTAYYNNRESLTPEYRDWLLSTLDEYGMPFAHQRAEAGSNSLILLDSAFQNVPDHDDWEAAHSNIPAYYPISTRIDGYGDEFPGDVGLIIPGDYPVGTYVLYGNVGANAGDITESTYTFIIDRLDKTAPVTTDNAPSGRQTSSFSIKLTCTDSESGCATTHYTLDGVSGTGTSIPINTNGDHEISYYSVDHAGRVETAHTINVSLDKVALTVTGFTANGVEMAGSLEAGYLLKTDGNPDTIYEIQFAEGSHVNKSVGDYYYTLYLNTALSVDNNTLTAYYNSRKSLTPEYRDWLLSTLDEYGMPFAHQRAEVGSNSLIFLDSAFQNVLDHDDFEADHSNIPAYYPIRTMVDDYGSEIPGDVGLIIPGDYPVGTYVLYGNVGANAGDITESTYTFIIDRLDKIAPTGEIVAPLVDTVVTDSVILSVNASDDGEDQSGINRVEFKNRVYYFFGEGERGYNDYEIQGASVYSKDEDGLYSYELDTSNRDEEYYVVAYVYDNVGHEFVTNEVHLSIDNLPPQIYYADATSPTSVEITFDEDLQNNETHSPVAEDFSVQISRGDENINAPITSASYADKVVTLTLGETLQPGDTVTFQILNNTPGTIIDLYGNLFDFNSEYDDTVRDVIDPTVSVSPKIALGKAGQPITFTPTTSDIFLGMSSYEWDFGDESEVVNGTGIPAAINHIYESAGEYTVTLTVYDAAENSFQGFDMAFPNSASYQVAAIIGAASDHAAYETGDGLNLEFQELPDGSYYLDVMKENISDGSTTGFSVSGVYYEIISSLINGTFTVNLTFDYADTNNDGVVDGTDVNETDLNVYYWNGSSWEVVSNRVIDAIHNTIKVTVNHFTQYALMAVVQSTGGGGGGEGGGGGGARLISPKAPAGAEVELQTLDIASPFSDIAGHWAEAYIETLRLSGFVDGTSDRKFEPNAALTRAELVKMVVALNGFKVPDTVSEKPFDDVNLGEWYATYIAVAKELKFIDGYDDGTFRPNQKISRVEALKVLLEAAKIDLEAPSFSFTDTNTTAWYGKYVSYAKHIGLIGGYTDGSFGPSGYITRAEAAKIEAMMLR